MGEHRTMRGRYELAATAQEIADYFGVTSVAPYMANGDIRPSSLAPIIRLGFSRDAAEDAPQPRECAHARWGLVPAWARDLRFGDRCVNARAETVDRLPAYRTAYRRRRCLIPASAFFEADESADSGMRWRISPVDGPFFALGGLWERWIDPDTKEGVDSFTIVTCRANSAIAPIHGRMPVIVAAANLSTWLDFRRDPRSLLSAAPVSSMRLTQVPLPERDATPA